MDDITLLDLAARYGTPLYVFDLDAFRSRAALVKDAFGPDVSLCYSIKANPFLVRHLPPELPCLEVCSPGELAVCEAVGADMSHVILSGVNKTRENVRRAMEDGVGTFTAESALHLAYINDAAREFGRTVPVLLRLTSDNQFGMDEADLRRVLAERASFDHIELAGLHYFSGTQKKRTTLIGRELTKLTELLDSLAAETGCRLPRLEYGAGLFIDYFGDDPDGTEQALLAEAAPLIREAARACRLTVEMGRFFSAACGTYLTTVMDTKVNCGYAYAIVDGGLHQMNYDGQVKAMQVPPMAVLNPAGGDAADWTLCGSLCTPNDVLVRRVNLTGLGRGGVLAFHRTGAYSICEGMALLLSRDVPAVVLYDESGGPRVAREHLPLDPLNTPLV